MALAIPPPSHIVCSPYRPPRCSRALTSIVTAGAADQTTDRTAAPNYDEARGLFVGGYAAGTQLRRNCPNRSNAHQRMFEQVKP